MENFESLSDLYKRVENDKNSLYPADIRYPIRFIFLNSFDELKKVVQHLSSLNINVLDLKDNLSNENTWFTTTELINIIKNLSDNTIFFPISEFLRFLDKNSFYLTIKSLTEIEKSNLRIYMPVVGLEERFEKEFWNKFYRRDEWAPIWKLDTFSDKINIFQINFDLTTEYIPSKNFKQISNTKEWLNVWKNDDLTNIISFSKTLSYFYKNFLPDQTFELEVINNQKEYLEKIFGINIPIEFNENESQIWNNLIKNVVKLDKKGLTLKEIFLKNFNLGNIESLTTCNFVKYYFNTNNQYDHWLIKNFVLSLNKFKFTYLYKCFEDLKKLDNENLTEKLWIKIFEMKEINHELFDERRILLKFIYNNYQILPNENHLENKLRNILNYQFKNQLNYLTNITLIEKEFIIESLKNEDIQRYITELKVVYPELYYYLDWDLIKPDNGVNDWIIDYFKEYNLSKIYNSKSKKISNLLNNQNKDKSTFSEWFYSIPQAKIEKNYDYIWIDGLGAEWFPLIIHLINKHGRITGKTVKNKMITRVNIPSTTKCNKYNFEKREELDQYIHKQAYKHPNTLIEEIEIVKKIIKNILNKHYENVCILSDHGLSFLCLKQFDNYKKFDFKDAKHEGRYMWIDKGYTDNEHYITWNVDEGDCKDKKAIIALKHASLNNTPPREVHGGATPEEVLVPYILIEMDKKKIQYEVEPLEFRVTISNPKIEFKIFPLPSVVPEASINNRSLKLSFDKNKKEYILDLKVLGIGKHSITLKIGSKVFELKVDIKGGFIERDLI